MHFLLLLRVHALRQWVFSRTRLLILDSNQWTVQFKNTAGVHPLSNTTHCSAGNYQWLHPTGRRYARLKTRSQVRYAWVCWDWTNHLIWRTCCCKQRERNARCAITFTHAHVAWDHHCNHRTHVLCGLPNFQRACWDKLNEFSDPVRFRLPGRAQPSQNPEAPRRRNTCAPCRNCWSPAHRQPCLCCSRNKSSTSYSFRLLNLFH